MHGDGCSTTHTHSLLENLLEGRRVDKGRVTEEGTLGEMACENEGMGEMMKRREIAISREAETDRNCWVVCEGVWWWLWRRSGMFLTFSHSPVLLLIHEPQHQAASSSRETQF